MKKLQKYVGILTLLLCFCLGMSLGVEVQADGYFVPSGSCGDNATWTFDGETLTITGTGTVTQNHNGFSSNEYDIKKIVIDSGIEEFADHSLGVCPNLESIEVAADNANFCAEGGVLFNKDKTILIKYPTAGANTYVVPDGVREIGTDAFSDNKDFTSIILPESLQKLGPNALAGTALTTITLPKEIWRIYAGALNIPTLTSINMEETIVDKYYNGFFTVDGVLYQKGWFLDVEKNEQVQGICLAIYPQNKSATSFTIPSGVTDVDSYAFVECKNLTSLAFPLTVERVGDCQFAVTGCPNLVSVWVPSTVKMRDDWSLKYDYYKNKDLTLYGVKGSDVETLALNSEVKFVEKADPAAQKPSGVFACLEEETEEPVNPPETEETETEAPVVKVPSKTTGQKALKLTAKELPLQKGQRTTVLGVKKLATGDSIVKWTSSKPKIVSVNARTGKLTAKKTGRATITVTMKSGAAKSCVVTVQKKAVALKRITLNKKRITIKRGKKFQLVATKAPLTATDKLIFSTSKKSVATVSRRGLITAKKKGTAYITVRNKKGVQVRCTVKVTK